MANKPSQSATFDPANPLALGPFYALRSGSGPSSADDAPAGAGPLTLVTSAAWATGAYGPVVRTSSIGDKLTAPDSPAVRRPTTALTLVVGVKPSGVSTADYAKYTNKLYGYANCSWGFVNFSPAFGVNTINGEISVGGVRCFSPTPDTDTDNNVVTLGHNYVAVLRWQSGQDMTCRIYDRADGTLLSNKSGTVGRDNVLIGPQAGTIDYDSTPLTVGYMEHGGGDSPSYAFGDYEFFGVSDRAWTNSEADAFAADPYQNFTAVSAGYSFAASSPTADPGSPVTLTVTLNTPPSTGTTVTFTPSVSGMTGVFSPTAPAVTGPSATVAFTFTPSPSTPNATTGSVSLTNDGGLGDAAPVAVEALFSPPSRLSQFVAHLTDPLTGANSFPIYSVANLGVLPDLNSRDHYDVPRCAYNARAYQVAAGGSVSDWSGMISASLTRLRDHYFLPFAGNFQQYHAYNTGCAIDHYNTGSVDSRDAALTLDAVYAVNAGNLAYYLTQEYSRECAFLGMTSMECEWLGRDHSTITEDLASLSAGHIAQWTAGSGSRAWATWLRPFMAALTCEFLVGYWERYRHNPDASYTTASGYTQASLVAAVPGLVRSVADYIWANDWLAPGTAYGIDTGGTVYGGTYVTPTTTWANGSFKLGHEDTFAGSPLLPKLGNAVRAGGSTTTFLGPLSLSTQDDYFRYAWVRFRTGAWAGYHGRVGAYAGSTRTFTLEGYTDTGGAAGTPPAAGDLFDLYVDMAGDTGVGDILYTGSTGASPDLNHLIAPLFARVYLWTGDLSYRRKYELVFNGGTMCWQAPTAQKQWNQATRWGFSGLDWESRGDAEWPSAATYTLTAPSPPSGPANVPSGLIRFALPAGRVAANPVKFTPAASTGRGSFVPANPVATNDRPYATARFVPDPLDANSSVTVTSANDGGLTNPAGFSYAVGSAAGVATGYALTGPATARAGTPFAVTLATTGPGPVPSVAALRAGGGATLLRLGDGFHGGSFTIDRYPLAGAAPVLAWVSAELTSQAVTYAEPGVGSRTLAASDPSGSVLASLAVSVGAPARGARRALRRSRSLSRSR